ncbi:glycosyltransferase [Microbacterium sp. P01]|uniref:glycosyltransferase n=1 Tax=unclassified Microbacterium TaxID=2609290 RepID=UPI003671CE38
MAPTWSLITVTYNSAEALREYWAGYEPASDVEWIVVDNASTDDSAAVARELGARVIALPENLGFGGANNVGFRSSSSQYVGFVNPDVSVRPGSLLPLQNVIDSTGGLVAPQLVNPDGTPQPNGRGYPFLAEKLRNRLGSDDAASTYRRFASAGEDLPVVWFMGAAVLGTRAHFEMLGPWDERFFVYYEDSDLGLRAAASGIPRIVSGKITWVHGWARETTRFEWAPWRREIPSMAKFYSRYPRLLSPWTRPMIKSLDRKFGTV